MEEQKFFLTVKPVVDRILILDDKNYLGDMYVANETSQHKTFNGTITTDLNAVYLICLGGEGKTSYKFNDIFSVPLELEQIKKCVGTWRNLIIINAPSNLHTPQSVKEVLIEFPRQWQIFFGLGAVEILEYTPIEKIKLPGKHENADYLAIGIDPNADTFMRYFDLILPKYLSSLTGNALLKLLDTEIAVACYISEIKYKYYFENAQIERIED